ASVRTTRRCDRVLRTKAAAAGHRHHSLAPVAARYTFAMTAVADPADELFHPVGEHPAWSESYYFNFVDPETGVGAFTRMGFRPNDGWADALHAVYLPGGRVAFTYGRRTDLS